MRVRVLVLAATVILAFGLVAATLAVAQGPIIGDEAPRERETAGDGAAPAAPLTPTLTLSKTVGTNPAACATDTAITVMSGQEVTYCYEVTNSSALTLTRHTLEDSALGPLINDFPYSLFPGASAYFTASAVITATTINTATWTAFNPGPTDAVTATATATVTVVQPAIVLDKTVGTNPNACASGNAISVTSGQEVTYCYEVTNSGGVTLTLHALEDSALGTLLTDFSYSLPPGASAFITESAVITETTVNTATWTSFNPGPTDVATGTATATVTVELPPPAIVLTKTVGTDPNVCATSDDIGVPAGEEVAYCYTVTNTGGVTLTLHTLEDSVLGVLLTDFPYDLGPGASTFITESAVITETTVNTATWTAINPGPADVAVAYATARVIALLPEIVVTPAALAAETGPHETATRMLAIRNDGFHGLNWTITFAEEACGEPGALPWASAAPAAGATQPGQTSEVAVTFDPSGLGSGGYDEVLCVSSDDPDEPVVSVPLSFTVGQYELRLPFVVDTTEIGR